MSLTDAIVGSLREGLVGAISGGVSGSTMILPCLPFESIMTFQAAGKSTFFLTTPPHLSSKCTKS
jgi:hypothetical protein